MMNRTKCLRCNLFVAILAAAGMACKPAVAPVLNLITDALFIPGGSAVAGVSMSFLLVGATLVPQSWTATKMGFLQGVLALLWGVSALQGLFVLVSYTIPGLVIDVLLRTTFCPWSSERILVGLAGVCGVISGALVANVAIFGLEPIPLLLFLAVGGLSGFLGSQLAILMIKKLRPILAYETAYRGVLL